MFELSACVEWLFAAEEPEFAARIARASAAGLPAVEFWTWKDKDVDAIRMVLDETGVQVTAFMSQPEARLVDPTTHDRFMEGIEVSAQVAESIGCRNLIVLAGDRLDQISTADQRRAVAKALKQAAPRAAAHGVSLLLESLNTRIDHVGHFLKRTADGLNIIEEVAEPNVRFLLDLYHSAVMNEQLDEQVGNRIHLVGHVHVADVPGRHEPGTGNIDWPGTIGWLQQAGYTGWLGLEYQPTGDTLASLSFITDVLEPHRR